MRLTPKQFNTPPTKHRFFYIPKHLLHAKGYDKIGGLETLAYSFMVDLSTEEKAEGFVFEKQKRKFIRHWLNISQHEYRKIIQHLIDNQLIEDKGSVYFVKNIYLPVQEKEEALYYG